MVVRNFFILCVVIGVFAVLFAKLVNYQHQNDSSARFDEQFWLQ